jgi:hypothetical protein
MIGISLKFLLLGIYWPFWLKPILAHGPCRKRGIKRPTKQLGMLTASLELSQCEIGLRVPLEGDDRQVTVERGASSQQDHKEPTIPTEFVRHGQGLDDRR